MVLLVTQEALEPEVQDQQQHTETLSTPPPTSKIIIKRIVLTIKVFFLKDLGIQIYEEHCQVDI